MGMRLPTNTSVVARETPLLEIVTEPVPGNVYRMSVYV
jgi:hypothetical protein